MKEGALFCRRPVPIAWKTSGRFPKISQADNLKSPAPSTTLFGKAVTTGIQRLELAVEETEDGRSFDWAIWLNPKLKR